MAKNYHAAVIGAGVFGSWTAYCLSRSGLDVALIDAFGAGNSRASSGGESRIIRMGYGASEIYTRWSKRALELWREFFSRAGESLFQPTGVLWMARENDSYTNDTVTELSNAGVKFEQLNRAELEHRYPQIGFGDIAWALYEPGSGALMARRAVQAVARETINNGATYLKESVVAPSGSGRLSELKTHSGKRIRAEVFVFACGPWLPKLFPDLLATKIRPTRQEVFFFGPPAGDGRFSSPQMPVWIDFGAEVYGLPDLENRGFKIAIDRHGPIFDPDTGERTITKEMLDEIREYMAHRFPDMKDAPLVESRVCQYENTSNGDFLIDRHPDFDNVWIVGGGSGHGFKHGPTVGEYVTTKIISGGEIDVRFRLSTKMAVKARSVF